MIGRDLNHVEMFNQLCEELTIFITQEKLSQNLSLIDKTKKLDSVTIPGEAYLCFNIALLISQSHLLNLITFYLIDREGAFDVHIIARSTRGVIIDEQMSRIS